MFAIVRAVVAPVASVVTNAVDCKAMVCLSFPAAAALDAVACLASAAVSASVAFVASALAAAAA